MKKYVIVTFLLLLIACQKEIDTISSHALLSNSEEEILVTSVPEAVIGEKQANPLDIKYARQAFKILDTNTKAGFCEDDVQPTHKYIAFTPSNEDEFYAIIGLDDKELFLSSYPLDYEVSDGRIVPDQRFMTNGYSYKWAYIPIDYDLNQIDCPYIYYYDVFAPFEGAQTKSGKKLPIELLDAIEQITYDLCGRKLKPVSQTKGNPVTPSGRIRFKVFSSQDTTLVLKGVAGLSIRTFRGLTSSYTHCDATGYFRSSNSFRYEFTYEIHFSRTDFIIRENDELSEVVLKYSDRRGPLNKDYVNDPYPFFATVTNAAINYYYRNIQGLRRPPMRDDSTARLAIQCQRGFNPDCLGYFTYNSRFILSDRPVLYIYLKDTNNNREYEDELFGTTTHELAHGSHWRGNPTRFYDTDDIVIETFAKGVEWLLTSAIYPYYYAGYYRQSYTGLIEDLIDGYSYTYTNYFASWVNGVLDPHLAIKSYFDNITGYTAQQIEQAVRSSLTWDELRNRLINEIPENADIADVTAAFDYWNSSY